MKIGDRFEGWEDGYEYEVVYISPSLVVLKALVFSLSDIPIRPEFMNSKFKPTCKDT